MTQDDSDRARERNDDGQYVPSEDAPTREDVLAEVRKHDGEPVSTSAVRRQLLEEGFLDAQQRTVYRHLRKLEDAGELNSYKQPGGGRCWMAVEPHPYDLK